MQNSSEQEEWRKVLKDMAKKLPREELLELRLDIMEALPWEVRLKAKGLTLAELLIGLSEEESLKAMKAWLSGLKPEEVDELRNFLEQRASTKIDNAS